MKNFRAILFATLLLLAACGSKDAEVVEKQQKSIVTFLSSKHDPALISERDLEESLEDEPEFYSMSGYTTYRYIADYYNPDRENYEVVKKGDTITITFWCYDFSRYTAPTAENLYFTNDPLYKSALEEAGLNTQYWSFEPQKITLGKGDTLKSIETALEGCRVGDTVELYMTFNMAYGSQWVGVTNLEEPMAFFCKIESKEN